MTIHKNFNQAPDLIKLQDFAQQRSFFMSRDYNEYAFNCWLNFIKQRFAKMALDAKNLDQNYTWIPKMYLPVLAARGMAFCNVIADIKTNSEQSCSPTELQESIAILENLNTFLNQTQQFPGFFNSEEVNLLHQKLSKMSDSLQNDNWKKARGAFQVLVGTILIATAIAASAAFIMLNPAALPAVVLVGEFLTSLAVAAIGTSYAKNGYRLFSNWHANNTGNLKDIVAETHTKDSVCSYNMNKA